MCDGHVKNLFKFQTSSWKLCAVRTLHKCQLLEVKDVKIKKKKKQTNKAKTKQKKNERTKTEKNLTLIQFIERAWKRYVIL